MYYIGIDLGGTNIAVGIVKENGEIVSKKSTPTVPGNMNKTISLMADLIKEVCKENSVSLDEIKSVGAGIPGTIDSKNGIVVYSNNLNMENFEFVKELQKYIDKPVFISNDANVAALGEAVAGGAKGCESAVIVTLGTGVGGGIILDGKIWEGFMSAGGEIGHTVICVDGEQCSCGRKGCWEAYSSATALIRDTKKAIDKNPGSVMAKMAEENGKVSGKTAFKASREGDLTAQKVVDGYIKHLAEGVANMINLLAPEIVLLGGGVSHEGDNLIKPLREAVSPLIYGGSRVKRAKIDVAKLGNDAGIIGAAMLGK